jgi:hypothetical protein
MRRLERLIIGIVVVAGLGLTSFATSLLSSCSSPRIDVAWSSDYPSGILVPGEYVLLYSPESSFVNSVPAAKLGSIDVALVRIDDHRAGFTVPPGVGPTVDLIADGFVPLTLQTGPALDIGDPRAYAADQLAMLLSAINAAKAIDGDVKVAAYFDAASEATVTLNGLLTSASETDVSIAAHLLAANVEILNRGIKRPIVAQIVFGDWSKRVTTYLIDYALVATSVGIVAASAVTVNPLALAVGAVLLKSSYAMLQHDAQQLQDQVMVDAESITHSAQAQLNGQVAIEMPQIVFPNMREVPLGIGATFRGIQALDTLSTNVVVRRFAESVMALPGLVNSTDVALVPAVIPPLPTLAGSTTRLFQRREIILSTPSTEILLQIGGAEDQPALLMASSARCNTFQGIVPFDLDVSYGFVPEAPVVKRFSAGIDCQSCLSKDPETFGCPDHSLFTYTGSLIVTENNQSTEACGGNFIGGYLRYGACGLTGGGATLLQCESSSANCPLVTFDAPSCSGSFTALTGWPGTAATVQYKIVNIGGIDHVQVVQTIVPSGSGSSNVAGLCQVTYQGAALP